MLVREGGGWNQQCARFGACLRFGYSVKGGHSAQNSRFVGRPFKLPLIVPYVPRGWEGRANIEA